MNEERVQGGKKVFSKVLCLPFCSFWAESLQNKPESCSCKPRRSCSVNPSSCSCRTLTRGNKCRCPGMLVQSPARWSSPSSASWTSCWAQTEKSFLQVKLCFVLVLCNGASWRPSEMLTELWGSTWREQQSHLRGFLRSSLRGRRLCCEGHERAPIRRVDVLPSGAPRTSRRHILSQSEHEKFFFLFLFCFSAVLGEVTWRMQHITSYLHLGHILLHIFSYL